MERGRSHLPWVSSPCNLRFSCNILFPLHLYTFHSPVKAHCGSSQVVGPPGAYNPHEKMIHVLNMELERAVWEEHVLENKKGSRCGNYSQEWEELWWKGVDTQRSMGSLNGIKARDHQGDRCEVNVGNLLNPLNRVIWQKKATYWYVRNSLTGCDGLTALARA